MKEKCSYGGLNRSISQRLNPLQNDGYIDTWNFIFETAPSSDDCIVGPGYPAKWTFKKKLKQEKKNHNRRKRNRDKRREL